MKIFILFVLLLQTFLCQARTVEPFNNGWSFKKSNTSSDPILFMQKWEDKWQEVVIPHTWNANDMQEKTNSFYAGEAYYKKSFMADKGLKNKRTYLHFEGVGQVATLYINGSFVGIHRGAYSAFTFEVTSLLKFGEENEILLKADNASRPDVIPTNHNLFGVYGGVYRPVWLITTEKTSFSLGDCGTSGVYISQDNVSTKQADVFVKVKVSNKWIKQELTLSTKIFDVNNHLVTDEQEVIALSPSGVQTFDQALKVKKPHLWNGREDPYLYRVEIALHQGDVVLDKVIQPLGLRHIEIKANDGVYLNGNKHPMYGVCRHQDRWGVGSALLNKHHDEDLDMMMEMGVTTVRLAHYQQSDYFYSKCDSLGLLVWAEIPFVNRVTTEEGENAKLQLKELIRQNYNHPSIYIWGLHNEVYRPHEYTIQLTQELNDLAKTEDPYRYTVAVNGYGHMEHPVNLNTDVQGMNRYFGWYEKSIPDMEPWVKDLETTFPDQKLMLTEYGAEANIYHQTEHIGNTIKWWGDYYPETYQTKTHEVHWGIIEKHPYIVASYVWNMFDFAVPMWKRGGVEARNMKGLVTIDRKVKKDAFYWYKANWSQEPVLYITQRRLVEREKKATTITVYSNQGEPTLTLNGKTIVGVKQGTTDVHYIFEDVVLHQGENKLEASVGSVGEILTDIVTWNFTKEQRRDTNEYLNPNAHFGF